MLWEQISHLVIEGLLELYAERQEQPGTRQEVIVHRQNEPAVASANLESELDWFLWVRIRLWIEFIEFNHYNEKASPVFSMHMHMNTNTPTSH